MKAPRFWQGGGWAPLALSPLSALWQAGVRRRLARGPRERLTVPVICIGNLVAGGAGKTPLAIAVMERLGARGIAGHFISRGYGGSLTGPRRVEPGRDRASETGDEPLLLAGFAPTWIGRDRRESARAAVSSGAQALVLDDGFQDPSLAHDLALLAVDAESGFGNGRVIPAGPLREPVAEGLSRAGLVVAIGPGDPAARGRSLCPGVPVTGAALEPLPTGMAWRGARVLAFAGIGRPEKFFATLGSLGADIAARHEFADHAPFPPAILQRLEREARALRAQLVTTEKDAVRLPPDFLPHVLTLPVRLNFHNPEVIEKALDDLVCP